ncbi:MAG: Clp protease N-terminal domain-containing protein, partial [Calditrichaceae bacterium]
MKSKDLRSLLLKLNNYLVRNLDTAHGLGLKRNHYEITPDHLWIALIEDGPGDIPLILKHYSIDEGRFTEKCQKNLEDLPADYNAKPRLSRLIIDLLEEAWIISSVHHKENKIRSGTLFEAFLVSDILVN